MDILQARRRRLRHGSNPLLCREMSVWGFRIGQEFGAPTAWAMDRDRAQLRERRGVVFFGFCLALIIEPERTRGVASQGTKRASPRARPEGVS